MNAKELNKLGIYLAYILRHAPDEINLVMDSEGWVSVENLIINSKDHYKSDITFEHIKKVVDNDSKGRYSFSSDKKRIRANQGHSYAVVNIEYETPVPPEALYHGTARRFVDSILSTGISPKERLYVHLTDLPSTAIRAGSRYGEAVVISVDTKKAMEDGIVFYQSENKVWLSKHLDPKYLTVL